jgi:hypothetical protein
MNPCTPGPWHVDDESMTATVRNNKGKSVARCYQGDDDAYLIAAAPDLFLCLCEFVSEVDSEAARTGDDPSAISAAYAPARAAIKKATQP